MQRWPISEITDYLGQIARLESSSRAFANFILDHGYEWEPQGFHGGYSAGVPRRCFGNAQDILFREGGQDDGLIYVEGYACSGSLSFAFPTHHAWLVDPEGRVVDPTWEDPEASTYFGVPFQPEYVRRTIRSAGMPCSMIDNFHDRWELITNPDIRNEAVIPVETRPGAVVRGS
ncbi:hypothetical protein G6L37_01605 [Agrobacterium rubi]|nr:hypothetical protein [Agrobacterium rubi]NTF24089.1 hypothetical protein [Agrobacterium rubi]